MKTSVKYGLFFALGWIIISMILYYARLSGLAFLPMIMVNLFLLMCAIAVGLYLTKREQKWQMGIFVDDFKTAMQGGFIYAILISAFVYLYHSTIDTSIIDVIVEERMDALHDAVPNEAKYKELQADDPTWQGKSFDDYIENQEDQIRGMVSPNSIFIMHLMGLSILAFLYSFGAAIVIRKVVMRGMK